MSLLQSILLGLVQGITEFLPVSSSGHLAILRNLFGIELQDGPFFDVMLHLGTMIAICAVFRKDLIRMLKESVNMVMDMIYNLKILIHNKKEQDARRYKKIIHNNYRKFTLMVLVSTVPTAVIGYAAQELVNIAGMTLIAPGVCLILNAGLLLVADVVEAGKKVPKDAAYTNAFVVGIAQGLAVMPGLSRSGITILACLLNGFDRRFAMKYSFIMSIPAIIGAMILELTRISAQTTAMSQIAVCLVGAIIAGITGYVCIRKMLVIVRKKQFKGFSLYCLVIGILAIVGHFLTR